jgi:hypothetical protein
MKELINNNEINDNPKQTFWINNFANCKSPKVLGKISIEEFLHKIKYGDENLLNIKNAREYGKGHDQYDKIKTTVLPTYRLNFHMEGTAKNLNVTGATGLIYIDVDNNIEIPHSDFIYAKWRSLSNTGYGILIKVNNLTRDNFKDVYSSLGIILDVNVDNVAGKAIQQNVLSYDPNLYYNTNSKVYECKISEKAPFSSIKKKKECIGVNDASIQERIKERVDNTHEYFVGGNYDKDYLYFENYVNICAPFMPWHGVNEGNRNNLLFRILSQFALLNPKFGKEYLLVKGQYFNKKMNPKLTQGEIHSIIHSVIEKRKEGTLEFYYNQKRLIIYNPDKKLALSEKQQITGAIVGERKSKKTQLAIYQIIENWDFEEFGKITQKLVIDISKFSRRTVQNHWIHFKDYIEDVNKEYNRKSA